MEEAESIHVEWLLVRRMQAFDISRHQSYSALISAQACGRRMRSGARPYAGFAQRQGADGVVVAVAAVVVEVDGKAQSEVMP